MIQDVNLFLKRHYPFSELPESALEALSFHIRIRFFPKGEVIFKEGNKPLQDLYIIRKGLVSLRVQGREVDLLHEGDCFGYPSLISDSPPSTDAYVQEDSILYLLPKEVFLQLVKKYENFESFFTKNIAQRLSSTAKMLRLSQGCPSLDRFFTLRVKDMKVREVPLLSPSESVLEASKLFRDSNVSCVLVKGKDAPGIVTERDIIKKVVAQGKDPKAVKLEDIATYPVVSIDEEDFLFEAMVQMAKNNLRRIGVEREGKTVGILEDRDIIAYESKNLIVIVKEIEKAQSLQELRYIYSIYEDTILQLFQSGVKVSYISRLISEINDKIMAKVVFLTIRELKLEPPVNFSIMVLGSEGRREQTLKTDQDNALIYEDQPSLDIDLKEYFDSFGNTYTKLLLEIGFPPCPGNVMVNNPQWRGSLSQWKSKLQSWISSPEPENTLRIGMFFDFRNVFGDESLTRELREETFRLAAQNELFVGYMILDALRFKPPLGFFRNFLLEKEGEHRGELDIKKGGIFPITHGVRALALKGQVEETGTLTRIEKLTEKALLPPDISQNLKEAFEFLQQVRLKSQVKKLREGKRPDNYVNPEEMSKLERDLLKDSFRIVEEFQAFLDRRYATYIPR